MVCTPRLVPTSFKARKRALSSPTKAILTVNAASFSFVQIVKYTARYGWREAVLVPHLLLDSLQNTGSIGLKFIFAFVFFLIQRLAHELPPVQFRHALVVSPLLLLTFVMDQGHA